MNMNRILTLPAVLIAFSFSVSAVAGDPPPCQTQLHDLFGVIVANGEAFKNKPTTDCSVNEPAAFGASSLLNIRMKADECGLLGKTVRNVHEIT